MHILDLFGIMQLDVVVVFFMKVSTQLSDKISKYGQSQLENDKYYHSIKVHTYYLLRSIFVSWNCSKQHNLFENKFLLEPICCNKRQKSSWPSTGLENRGHLMVLNFFCRFLQQAGSKDHNFEFWHIRNFQNMHRKSFLLFHYYWAFHPILVTSYLVVFGDEVTKIFTQ